MKRIIIISALVLALFLTAFVVVRAETRGRQRWCGHRWHHLGPAAYLAHELKLSDAQEAQIGTLWQAERPVLAADVRELAAENKKMNAITSEDTPDHAEVQKIADLEANTIAKMLAEKARLQAQIYSTVLRPDQRVKADDLQKKLESGLDRLADHLAVQSTDK